MYRCSVWSPMGKGEGGEGRGGAAGQWQLRQGRAEEEWERVMLRRGEREGGRMGGGWGASR